MAETFAYYKAEKIADDSWMIKNAFMEPTYAQCYLVEGDNYALLIDSIIGFANLKTFCETLTDKKIILVNTHAHSDHIGGNFFFDCCYMHPRDMAPVFTSTILPLAAIASAVRATSSMYQPADSSK